jgi:hypothetical protein
MIERPILFSAPMIRAILAGTKTQTRRIIKPQPATHHDISPFDCRHGLPGDQLWVRETFWRARKDCKYPDKAKSWIGYPADLNDNGKSFWESWGFKKTPSIHMPRAASRITIEITGTRPERLQDISKADVIAEGITERRGYPIEDCHAGWHERYADLWEAINGPRSWIENPLVWVISFRRLKPEHPAQPV